MFENLSEKLQRAFKTLRGQAVLNEENIQEAMREIRLALLEADVNFKVVKQLIDHIQEKAVGQQVATALSPGEQVIKIVRDELIEPQPLMLGSSDQDLVTHRLKRVADRTGVAKSHQPPTAENDRNSAARLYTAPDAPPRAP